MGTRSQNERRFEHWQELPDGGRRYWLDVVGHRGWQARYIKVVDRDERTVAFRQEIRDASGELVEVHEKYPVDRGHRKT